MITHYNEEQVCWKLIAIYFKKKRESAPGYFVSLFREGNITTATVRDLQRKLRDRTWQSNFVAHRGVEWMFYYLQLLLVKLMHVTLQRE